MHSRNTKALTAPVEASPKTRLSWFTKRAQDELARRHYYSLIDIAKAWNSPEPADAASAAILRALRDFDPDKGSFIGLSREAMRFIIRDQWRTLLRRPIPERLPEDCEVEAPEVHVFQDREELDRLIHDVWMTLNIVDQRLLWLRIVGGFTFKEIGSQLDFLGCPLNQATMRSRFCRAMRKMTFLHDCFEDLELSDVVDSFHRVAQACGTLDFKNGALMETLRSLARRQAAQKRCRSRRKPPR